MTNFIHSRAGRKPRFDERRRQIYLDALADSGVMGHAMNCAGIASRATLKNAREKIDGFAAAEADALEDASDRVEDLARTRSEYGQRVPVLDIEGNVIIDQDTGKPETTFIQPSEKLLLARLKALKPEKYGTKRHEVKAENSGVLLIPQFQSEEEFAKMLDAVRQEALDESRSLQEG